jgi:hypothetical protein
LFVVDREVIGKQRERQNTSLTASREANGSESFFESNEAYI